MQVILYAITAATALILLPGLLFHFDVTPKLVVLLVGTAMSLLFFRKNVEQIRGFIKTTPGAWFFGLLLAHLGWSALATATSTSVDLSLYGSSWRRFGLITLTALVVTTLLSAAGMAVSIRRIVNVLRALALSGVILSLYVVFQYFGLDPLLVVEKYHYGYGAFQIVRPPGTFGHADYLATWLVLVVFAGVAIARVDPQRWMRTMAGVTLPIAILAIVLSGTRAALLGLAVGAAFLAVLRVIPLKRLTAFAAAAIAILFVIVFSPPGMQVRARIHWSSDDSYGGARLGIWRDSLKMAMRHPITGFGPETFSLIFPQLESIELARAYPDFHHESSHNVLLDELTAKGVPGLLIFVAIVFTALCPAFCAARASPLVGSLCAAFFSLFICQQFSVFVVGTALAFYLSAAMLIASTLCPIEIVPVRRQVVWFALPAVALSALFLVYAARLTVGDYDLSRVARLVDSQQPDAAAREFDRATKWLPTAPSDDLYFSRVMAGLVLRSPAALTQALAWREALNHAVRAVATSEDRSNAWYNLALLLAHQNDTAGVERSLRNAIAWAPNWFKPHWKLAEVLALSGRRAESLVEAEHAVDLDGGRDAEVNATYQILRNQSTFAR